MIIISYMYIYKLYKLINNKKYLYNFYLISSRISH